MDTIANTLDEGVSPSSADDLAGLAGDTAGSVAGITVNATSNVTALGVNAATGAAQTVVKTTCTATSAFSDYVLTYKKNYTDPEV